jgi:hypothetical protein
MAGLEKLVAEGVAARLGKRDDIPWRFFTFNTLDMRSCCAPQRFDLGKCEQRLHFDMVRLPQAMCSQELIRKIAVIGEKHQSRRMVFESTDGENALRNAVEQIAQRAAAFGIAHCGDNFRGLMQQQVNSLLRRLDEFARDFDVVARLISFAAEFGNGRAIHCD